MAKLKIDRDFKLEHLVGCPAACNTNCKCDCHPRWSMEEELARMARINPEIAEGVRRGDEHRKEMLGLGSGLSHQEICEIYGDQS